MKRIDFGNTEIERENMAELSNAAKHQLSSNQRRMRIVLCI